MKLLPAAAPAATPLIPAAAAALSAKADEDVLTPVVGIAAFAFFAGGFREEEGSDSFASRTILDGVRSRPLLHKADIHIRRCR